MLEHNIKLKVKNHKTNISIPIDKFVITHFKWDLRSSNVIIEVEYYIEEKYVFTNEFVYQEKEEVVVNKLIDDIIKKHYEQTKISQS